MTAKKDDTCGAGSGSAITDELAPLRKWEGGMSSGGYTSGPSHLDRMDFSDAATDAPSETDEPIADEPNAAADDDTSTADDVG